MSNIYHSMLLTIKKKINAVFLLLVIAVSAFFRNRFLQKTYHRVAERLLK